MKIKLKDLDLKSKEQPLSTFRINLVWIFLTWSVLGLSNIIQNSIICFYEDGKVSSFPPKREFNLYFFLKLRKSDIISFVAVLF